ncbi:MAG: hypothetical protein E7500_00270 [Ruminococcus sp.]|nr:hypothetical protein [Ruminococcus sp.]
MDLREKATALAEELGIDFSKVHRVIGVTAETLEGAFNGHKKSVESVTKFFTDREAAFEKYTPEQVEIIRTFERSIPENGSASKAAEKIGIGPAVISGLRKGTYKGVTEKYFAELSAYFKIKQEKNELPDVFTPVDYAPTTISQMIYQRLRNVHVLGGCAVITGDAGIGKTKTIQKYARDNRTKTIVITASVLNHTVTDVLYLLAEELGISDTNKRRIKAALFSKIRDGMIIIIDEAQELTYQAANALRAIPDYFEAKGETVGLAFVGNPCFYNKFNGKYTSDRVQVSSRFVTESTYSAEQIQFEDTKMLYPQLAQQNMQRELMFLHSIATTPNLGQRKALFIFKEAYNYGKYDLDALVKRAKSAKMRFNNLNEILNKIKEVA